MRYHKTTITVEVLSREPLPATVTLAGLHEGITFGEWSGYITHEAEEIDAKQACQELRELHQSDPEFLGITHEGG